MNAKAIVSGAVILFVGNLLSSLLGLGREVLLAHNYGANVDMDAYLFANTIPSMLLSFVSGVYMASFIPLFIKQRVEISVEKANLMYNNTLNWLIVIIVLVTVVCYVFSDSLSSVFAIDALQHDKIKHLLWILLPNMLFFSVSYAQSSVLSSLNHFTLPALLTVLNNIIVITFMHFFHASIGIYSVAWGFLIGTALQVLVQIPVLIKKGIRYRLYLSVKDEYIKKLVLLSIPVIGLVIIDQSLQFATRFFSSSLEVGSASALNYSSRIIMLPVTLFGTALISASFPSIVQMLAEKKEREYSSLISTSMKSLALILIPVMILCMAFSFPIIRILFQRGAFDSTATEMTAIAFLIFAIGIVIIPVREFCYKLFFGKENMRIPIHCSALYLICFVSMCLLLVPKLHYIGIAVSGSSSSILSFSYLLVRYKRLNPNQPLGLTVPFLSKIISSALLAAAMAYCFYYGGMKLIDAKGWEIVLTPFSLGLGMILYFGFIRLWKVEEMNFVIVKLSAKFNFNKRRSAIASKNSA
ncbi:murein biosynthesis integral membrane protein MurJ [Cohnella mopanensis]|uniref:murein biosynthesis integral membrane protein MurJ n=1 Tax=Cohnella mopanensis TaxID=2911966 RepID=UPI001EF779F9|nr:murein biosynthesis integral membrane protein MurJ [Cohnella mopanensis]